MNGLISSLRRSRSATLRGFVGIAAAASIALAVPAAVMANDLHQSSALPIAWNDPGFQGSADECAGADLAEGQVLWHFVHTKTDGSDLPATLEASFSKAGNESVDGYSNGNGKAIVQYTVITGKDSLTSASDPIDNDGLLNLSHICSNIASSTSTTSTPGGGVEHSTGKPKVTIPPTSTFDSAPASTGSSWPIVLIGLGSLMTGLFVLKPSSLKIRNRR